MTTYRTGNAIGSADPRDLYDNAENLDELVNSQDKAEHPDRLGVPRKTWHGMEQDFQSFLQSSGYQDLGDYAPGIEITARNQVIRADGELWRISASIDLPYTTDGSGMPEGGAFVSVGDAVLRGELADGTAMVTSSNGEKTLAEALDERAAVYGSVAELLSSTLPSAAVGVSFRAGSHSYTVADPSATDNDLETDGGVKLYVDPLEDGSYALDAFAPDGTRAGDSVAIKKALSRAGGNPIRLSAKRYFWDGTVINIPVLKIYGSGMPAVNPGKTALEGGSIIDGTLGYTSPDVDLRDFGVDVGSSSSAEEGDAIRGTTNLNAGGHLHTENIVGLCKSPSSAYHALLFQSYQKHTGDNLLGVYGYFGFVTKSQNVDLGLVHSIENDESGVLLKSDTDFGRCRNVSIQRVRCDGSAGQKRGLHVQSSDDNLRNVQVGLVEADGVDESVLLQVGTSGVELRNIEINAIQSRNARTVDLRVDNRNASAAIFNVHLGFLSTENTALYGFRVEGAGQVNNFEIESAFISYEPGAAQATMDSAVVIGSNCISSRIGSLRVVRNFSLTSLVGGLVYNTATDNRDKHALGPHLARVFGNTPRPGFSSVTISGTGNTVVVPRNSSGQSCSLSQVVPTASGTQVNNFGSAPDGTDNFPVGHVFTVYNGSSSQNLAVLDSSAGGIRNKGGSTVTIPPTEVASWVYTGSGSWREM